MSPFNNSQKDYKSSKPQYIYTNRDKYYDESTQNYSKQNVYASINSVNVKNPNFFTNENKFELSPQYEILARKEYEDLLDEKLKEFQLTTKNFLFKFNSDPLINSILNNFKNIFLVKFNYKKKELMN